MRFIIAALLFVVSALALASAYPHHQFGLQGGFNQGFGGFNQGFGAYQQPIELNAAGLPCEKFCKNSFTNQYYCCETLQNTFPGQFEFSY